MDTRRRGRDRQAETDKERVRQRWLIVRLHVCTYIMANYHSWYPSWWSDTPTLYHTVCHLFNTHIKHCDFPVLCVCVWNKNVRVAVFVVALCYSAFGLQRLNQCLVTWIFFAKHPASQCTSFLIINISFQWDIRNCPLFHRNLAKSWNTGQRHSTRGRIMHSCSRESTCQAKWTGWWCSPASVSSSCWC